jgi:hypothetical protein
MTQTKIYNYLNSAGKLRDARHASTLSWMVSALLGSQTVNLAQWGVFVQSRATQEASHQRRWRRFVQNERVEAENIYVPLVLQAISGWKKKRIYLVLDTTVLWNQFCLISLAMVTGGRAVPFLWLALEHSSASVAWGKYQPLLEKARQYLQDFEDVMLLADRGFANQDLLGWLPSTAWHWAIRLPSDTQIRGVRCRGFSYAIEKLYPPKREAVFYEKVSLWQEGSLKANLALASVPGTQENWAIITDEPLSLEVFWQYGLRFRTEHLFLDSKSGVFQWESSSIRSAERLGCLYLVIAIAILFGTLTGMAVEQRGMRRQVDAHLRRGLSYLKIGVRWLRAVVHQSKPFVFCQKLLNIDPLPCFACRKAEERYYRALAFSRIQEFHASS